MLAASVDVCVLCGEEGGKVSLKISTTLFSRINMTIVLVLSTSSSGIVWIRSAED